ncbi:MAG TPA: hypothetical protein VGH42_05920 [Verrucomicrobiae bacterium]
MQVRPEGAPADWKPTCTYNLPSDRKIPFSTYAKFIVDTATSLGQQGDKAFFKNQAQTHIALALEALYLGGWEVTFENVHEVLLDDSEMDAVLCNLAGDPLTRPERHTTISMSLPVVRCYRPVNQNGFVHFQCGRMFAPFSST